MRILFFNEGNLGTVVMGQGQLEGALRAGLARRLEVQSRFAGLTPMGRWARALAVRPLPPLARWNLDLRTLRWHSVQALRARAALERELRTWPADAVLVHSHTIALAMRRTMRRTTMALSVDVTAGDWSNMPAWRASQAYAPLLLAPSRALERRALEGAALVFAWTEWARKAVARDAPGANAVEHHPGIDLERYRPAARRERRLPRVLFVGGRFAPKGGQDLLDALAGDLGQTVELDLVTPADVPERPGVRVHRLSPSDPELLDLQQQADVFCLPTHGDAAPCALLEAMACGTAALATRIGRIPDMLDHGHAGVLVDHGDVRQLREALQGLLTSPARRATLAGAAGERCRERYDARRQFERMIEHLRCHAHG